MLASPLRAASRSLWKSTHTRIWRSLLKPYSTHHNSNTQDALNILGNAYSRDAYTNVTPAILSKLSANLHAKPGHPIHTVRSLVESHFPRFSHLTHPNPLVTPAQNFDDLAFPSDHPGRSVTDSYYVNKDMMLRTHTSAHEVETFARACMEWLLTADVYRRDEIDATHYPVFHQMEGARVMSADPSTINQLADENALLQHALSQENILIEDRTAITETNPYQLTHDPVFADVVTQNLKHSLNGLILKLFSGVAGVSKQNPLKVRWIEAFFPFTSPSYEVEVFFNDKWLEILGCGVVRQSTLDKASVQGKIGWAFGLGLERLAMILFSIPDIRLFWSQDARFLSQFQPGTIAAFQPFSKFPACYKDLSFWMPATGLHENDFCDLVRTVAGDMAETVTLIDSFTHPITQRASACYRINYRSMERSLSNSEVNEIHTIVATRLVDQFGVEIR